MIVIDSDVAAAVAADAIVLSIIAVENSDIIVVNSNAGADVLDDISTNIVVNSEFIVVTDSNVVNSDVITTFDGVKIEVSTAPSVDSAAVIKLTDVSSKGIVEISTVVITGINATVEVSNNCVVSSEGTVVRPRGAVVISGIAVEICIGVDII
jgi:hypothetical protein